MRTLAHGLLLLAVLAWPVDAFGQNLVTLQFSFSNPGARSLGIGGAFVALADDATAAYANPAGLTQLVRPEMSVEGRSWRYATTYVEGGRASGAPTGLGLDTDPGGGHLTLQGAHPVYTIFPPRIREAADTLAAKTPLNKPVDLDPLGLGLSLVRSTESARLAVRERALSGMDAIKITVESGPTPFGDHHPQMSVEMIRAIVTEAESHGLRVFAHATSLDDLQAALAGGAAGIVHAVRNRLLPDGAQGDALAAAGFRVLPTLVLYAGAGDLDDPFLRETVSDEEIAALRGQRFLGRIRRRWECCAPLDEVLASVGRLHDQGVPIVLGTDTGNAYVFPGYRVHRELELLVEAGLSPMEALVSATSAAAEMIGAEHEFGTIEPGKRADLLILAADPLEDIGNTRSLEVVISEGRVIDRRTLLGSPDSESSHDASP